MVKKVALDQQNVFVRIRLLTDSTGAPATGVTAATAGHTMWYQRDSSAVVTDGGSAADMSALTDAHTDWEFLEIREGRYWCAFPDAAFANGSSSVDCGMSATGISCVVENVVIEPLFKYHGQASSVTSTTTTFPSGPVVKAGDEIYVTAGTGIGQTRLITSAAGQVATHAAWDDNISATTSTILLIAGDGTKGQAAENVDVASSTLSTVTPAQVESSADSSLGNFFTKSPSGNIDVNIAEVAEVAIDGVGSDADPFGPV